MMKCKKCEGKGWIWDRGMDYSEDCSFCNGTGKLDEPTIKLVEQAAVRDYPKTNFLKAFFNKRAARDLN